MINNVAFTINLFGVTRSIYWYGIIIALAMLLGIWVATYNARRRGYKSEMVLDIALVAVISAVLGARIHYVVFSWEFYRGGPFIEVFKIWNGGLAIYGGLIGGLIGTALYCKFSKKRFFAITDIVIPSLILGQAIGRWGNFANQEAYGWLVTNPAWTFFPASVFVEAERAFHMATFFYESMWNVLIFLFLMYYMKKDRKEGNVFYLYLLLYGIGRAVIETFRTDSQWLFSTGIKVNQLISIILILFAIIMLILRKNTVIAKAYNVKFFNFFKRKEKETEPTETSDTTKVSEDLKLMDDRSRQMRSDNKKGRRIQPEAELAQVKTEKRAKKEDSTNETTKP
ncbi:MAG: prolipoprotein diacylglyceryl transferase [Clostridiales bacterium]|nr:prolipoprotein diacylglyceryl transferase [Clostridiales bacterium]